ncbi:MAG: hypothetical protein H8D46_01065 [FCB group bacterium]|nr:hypothetical protein [FCB group bacterium]
MGSRLELEVQFLQSGTVISESTVQMIVGPVNSTDPVPACDYGYWAFDNTDTSYEQAPEYNWIDIAEVGTDIGLTDDTVVHDIEIGFPFTYFGQTYETVTVCSNGWFSFERQTVPYFWNFSIPMAGGASSMVAPFNDDLDDNGGTEPFNVYVWQDAESSRFILQWDNVANGEDDEFCPVCVRETFQAILYDSAVWETPTGDGEIVFQYSEIHDLDENGNYSTIGIESPDQNDGVQYLFNNQLAPGAAQLADGLAIKFTTSGPQSGCFKGDVNLDGIPDILDIVMMISVILNDVPVLTPEQFCAADMIEDGILDILDIVNLVSVILE